LIPLAEVLRRHWPAYERKYRARLLPSHRRAVTAILSCRTPALGGQLYRCACGQEHYAYHSCNHRACPQCGHADATEWLERQRCRLLPVPYYLVTFTVPQQLRKVIRSNQKILYALLLTQSAAALLEVARDHKDLGAKLGLMAVLQTWTRDLRYHPHVHCVVPAGGLSPDELRWVSPKRENYFLPQAALAMRLRTRLKETLQQDHPALWAQIPSPVWSLNWVADVQPVGTGEPALKYLAAEAFLHRLLQHVLPRGFQRIRYFGFLSAASKKKWRRVLALLDWTSPPLKSAPPIPVPLCANCKKPMALLGQLARAPPRRPR
jgi:hypothetical protein